VISGCSVTDDPYSVGEVDELARARGVHLELDAVTSGMALLAKVESGSTSSIRSSSISPARSCGWRERPACEGAGQRVYAALLPSSEPPAPSRIVFVGDFAPIRAAP